MSSSELRHYNQVQIRVIRKYHSHVHPELDSKTAAVLWINMYAAKFRAWWENTVRNQEICSKGKIYF